jgi:DNA-binding beta-propeller fold protein YncE
MLSIHRVAAPALVLSVALLCTPSAAQGFANFESPQTKPIRLSPSGQTLCVTHSPAQRILAYSLTDPSRPRLLRSIRVGLEPVSVHPRDDDEVWVVSHLSDAVQVVSIARGRVIDTIEVGDEPADVVFARGKAFVSVAGERKIKAYDLQSRQLVAQVQVFGKQPRALAVSNDGSKVYVASFLSGNRTTTLPKALAPAQPSPSNPALPAPPQVPLIIKEDDPQWANYMNQLGISQPDNDLFEIDAVNLTPTRTITGLGTHHFAIAIDPRSGRIALANQEARNHIRFEPTLRGHVVDHRISFVDLSTTPATTQITDLNPGINYSVLPNPSALGTALAHITDLVFHPTLDRLYVASFGTDRIGVLDGTSGTVLARWELGNTPGAQVDPRNKRGPRGLAISPGGRWLYVSNRLSSTLTVFDTQSGTIQATRRFLDDPTPLHIREGRGFLYDTKLSGNGTVSCASCHLAGDLDDLAWDLGNPAGQMELAIDPTNSNQFNLHPMKGPMTTQTLKGLKNTGPFHWRGDKATIHDFNPAFDTLLGGSVLSQADMNRFVQFIESMRFGPNPNLEPDGSLPTTPSGSSAADGKIFFETAKFGGPGVNLKCIDCHAFPAGTNGFILDLAGEPPIKTAQLRNVYKRLTMDPVGNQRLSGFGLHHDGVIPSLFDFFSMPVFGAFSQSTQQKQMMTRFVECFPTGTDPVVGRARFIDAARSYDNQLLTEIVQMFQLAQAGQCDIVLHGVHQGEARGWVYEPLSDRILSDRQAEAPLTAQQMLSHIRAGDTELLVLGVAPGEGRRLGIDADDDGVRDGDEGLLRIGYPSPVACSVQMELHANMEPELGRGDFTIWTHVGAPGRVGFLGIAATTFANPLPILGMDWFIDSTAFPLLPLLSNNAGWAAQPLPLPSDPSLHGNVAYLQSFFAAPACTPNGLAASSALRVELHR